MKCALVVGSGSIAKRHIRNINELYPSANILCCSSSGRTITPLEVGATKVTSTLEEAILFHPEIAVIASPANMHIEHALKLAQANIPILIEKPLCMSLADLKTIHFDPALKKIAVGYNLRFLPAAQLVKEKIVSGVLGEIFTAFADVGQYLPDWRPESNYRNGVSAQRKLGGGALLELSHELDYLTWFFGSISDVSAKLGSSGTLDIDVEDSVDALMTTKTGVVVHLHLDFLQRTPKRHFKVVGSSATLTWDVLKNEVVLESPESGGEVVFSEPEYDRNLMYKAQITSFISDDVKSQNFSANWISATEVMRLVEAIKIASKSKSWVEVSSLK